MQEVRYRNQLVGIAEIDGGVLVGATAVHEPSHPDRRFATQMLLYAVASVNGQIDEPYDDSRAELYARTRLMPDDDFDEHHLDADHELAERFVVPIAEIRQKRNDLVEWWGRPNINVGSRCT